MTTSVVALLATVVLALVVPAALCRGLWWVGRPRLALGWWLASLGAGVAGIVVAVGALVLPAPAWEGSGCLGCGPAGVFWWSLALALALGGLLALVGARAEACWAHERASRTSATVLVAGARPIGRSADGTPVLVVDDPRPVALSTSACGGHILLSASLVAELSAEDLQVVVAHEQAHLRERHEWVRRLARLNHLCFPRLLGARVLESRVHLMLELIADDGAVRAYGAERTASALTAMGRLGDPGARLRAERLLRAA